MAIDKNNVREVVEVFYQAPFKIFSVNSLDGETFTKVDGVFVSLGLTVPIETITEIKGILNKVKGYKARVAELKSTKMINQFLNVLTDKEESEINSYNLDFPENSYNKEGLEELIKSLHLECKEMYSGSEESKIELEKFGEKLQKIQTLKDLREKMNTVFSWDNSVIFKDSEGNYKVFHKNSNYLEQGNACYRVGIYVEEE
jgi:hypothetical protein